MEKKLEKPKGRFTVNALGLYRYRFYLDLPFLVISVIRKARIRAHVNNSTVKGEGKQDEKSTIVYSIHTL